MGMIPVVIANMRIITNMLTVSFDPIPVRGISSHGHTHSLYDTARRLLNENITTNIYRGMVPWIYQAEINSLSMRTR
jgi:hypothetical protein